MVSTPPVWHKNIMIIITEICPQTFSFPKHESRKSVSFEGTSNVHGQIFVYIMKAK